MGIGGWQTTGERTGAMVMVYQYFPDDLSWDNLLVPGYISPGHTFEPGVIMRRLTLEVDASGNHLTARGTFEVYDAAGNLGQSQDVDGWEAGRLIPVPASGATPAS